MLGSTSMTETTMIGSRPNGKFIAKNKDIDTKMFSAVSIFLSGSDITNVKKVRKVTLNKNTIWLSTCQLIINIEKIYEVRLIENESFPWIFFLARLAINILLAVGKVSYTLLIPQFYTHNNHINNCGTYFYNNSFSNLKILVATCFQCHTNVLWKNNFNFNSNARHHHMSLEIQWLFKE